MENNEKKNKYFTSKTPSWPVAHTELHIGRSNNSLHTWRCCLVFTKCPPYKHNITKYN